MRDSAGGRHVADERGLIERPKPTSDKPSSRPTAGKLVKVFDRIVKVTGRVLMRQK